MFKLSEKCLNNYFEKIWSDELNQLVSLFKENKFEIRIAGGAVRDLLMNIEPHDIDFATDATPNEMKEMFTRNNIRLINNNGESHGTITARINDKENFEVTTLRIDKVTDGRRAEVEFTKDWKIDAERRDLTINSMFLDKEGIVYDYFDGYYDLKNRIIRFVGNVEKRIQEDYLRILRYFRFYGRIAESPNNHLEETITKIKENKSGLANISGERIWMELKKIISGNFTPELIKTMDECCLLPYLGLPANPSLVELNSQYHLLKRNQANPAVILATILSTLDELKVAVDRLKISNEELLFASFILREKSRLITLLGESDDRFISCLQDEFVMHLGEPARPKLRLCYLEFLKYTDRLDLWQRFDRWKMPQFPISGNVLGTSWKLKGKKLGLALQFLKRKWQETNYTATCEDLVDNETFRVEFMKCESGINDHSC